MSQENDKRTPVDRLNYTGNLNPVIENLAIAYNVGTVQDFSVIPIGYEDCNIVVQTEQGKFLSKIFSKERTPEDITRYTTIMQKVIVAGANHPPLLETQNKSITYQDPESHLQMVLMKFIEGNTFFELDREPNNEERRAILEQAAIINNIDYQPPYIFDSWAIPNLKVMFEKVRNYIDASDLNLVEEVIKRYSLIPVDKLPHAFVHGDFTKTNVLKGDDGKIYILDFSVANWYPRIQELAVISANLLHDKKETPLGERVETVTREYDIYNSLTSEEKKYLYDYALAGIAMEFLGSHQEKFINGNNSEETEYWLTLGREGLRRELG